MTDDRSDPSPTDARRTLAAAVRADDAAAVRALLDRHPALAAALSEPMDGCAFGELPLLVAAERGSRETIDALVDAGADPNARSRWWAGGFGALDVCAPAVAPQLLARGARPDACAAARLGMLDALRALLDADPSRVHARGGDGQTPLHCARTVDVAALLLDRGAEIDALDVDHESTPAQHMAGDRPDVARFLVSRGARTDLLLAVALGDVARVRRHLDDDPASIRTTVTDRWLPMRDRRAGGHIYNWSLERHATPHRLARRLGHDEIHALLLERSPDDLRLLDACDAGDAAAVRALLAERPHLPRTLPDDVRRALPDAATRPDAALVERMLAAGWPVDARGQHGATALHWAAWHGDDALVRTLLAHAAPLDARDADHGGTPLSWAFHASRHGWHPGHGDYGATVTALLAAGAVVPDGGVDASDAVREALRRHAAG